MTNHLYQTENQRTEQIIQQITPIISSKVLSLAN